MKRDEAAFPGEVLPAPPIHQGGNSYIAYPGLTKRELFAAMAMQGMCQGNIWASVGTDTGRCEMYLNIRTGALAATAIGIADTLLAELAK